jgi:hypothetical protein
MADNKLLSQMLEHLVNEDQAKAEELFHEYVVAKSREIYENLIETEISEEEKDEDDEEVDEAAKDEDAEDDKVDEASDEDKDDEKMDEEFEDIAIEADDEMGGDATDDLEAELGDEPADAEGEESEEEIMQDLGDIIDELQAKFDALQGEEEEQGEFGDEEGGDMGDEPKMDAFEPELETVREYVEKVPAGHGAEKKGAGEKADNTRSTIDNMKNDMGGTTANILSGRDGATGSETGALKGNGLLKGSPKEDNAGNINVPGGKAGSSFSKKEPGHGAEKKGSAESADNKQSLFRGRR